MEQLRQQLMARYPSGYMLPVITHWNHKYRKHYKFAINKTAIRKALNGYQGNRYELILRCVRNLLLQ